MPAKKSSVKKIMPKAVPKNAAPKVALKVSTPKAAPKTAASKPVSGKLSAPTYSLIGAKGVEVSLPKEIFGAKVNEKLLAQALRVYTNNLKGHFSNTKTRGEVQGSTAKMGPQKGSGRARHGGKRAPIYRGGGIALGPKSRNILLDLPKKMKKAALISALSQKMQEEEVEVISNLDKASGKTKEMATLVKKLGKRSILFVTDEKRDNLNRAVSNIEKAHSVSAEQLNVYEVIKFQSLALSKEAVEVLEKRLVKE